MIFQVIINLDLIFKSKSKSRRPRRLARYRAASNLKSPGGYIF